MNRYASKIDEIQPFHVMAILARAKELEAQGHDVIHMEVGEPEFSTPDAVTEAGIVALREGKTHYTPAIGLPELRQAISNYYADQYTQDIPAERIVVTPGSSGALQLITSLILEPDSEVLVTDPGYPCNRHFVRLAGGMPVPVNTDAQNHYQPTLEQIQAVWTPQTRAVMIASPANPTGTVIQSRELARICAFAEQREAYVIVDEIYHGLEFERRQKSAATLSDNVFVINSFSKYFGMTGWRIGWLVAPADLVPQIDKLAQNVFLAPPTVSQYAALEAFSSQTIEELDRRKAIFKERSEYLIPALRELGFSIPSSPDGAFYVYANCEKFSPDSFELANCLLESVHVAVTPGLDFGSHQSSTHLRFTFTNSIERLKQAVTRIERYINNNQ
ncbi:MAG: pyridoxal phosphate-dependent aminotransferase [Gammaproteobacteria bacterium]|nr:pyridoxal phosphate-dependent aminotransferase [Gammaproteobacteria bacterium]